MLIYFCFQTPPSGEGRAAEQRLHPEGHCGVRQGPEGGQRPAGGEAEAHRDPTEEDAESHPGLLTFILTPLTLFSPLKLYYITSA